MNKDKKYFTFWWFFILLNFGFFVFLLLFICLYFNIEQLIKDFNTHPFAISATMLLTAALGYAALLTSKYLIVPVKKNEPNLPAIWVVIVLLFVASMFAALSAMGNTPLGPDG